MKNWIIVLLIFVIPLGVFAWLETNANKSVAKEACEAVHPVTEITTKPRMLKFSSPMCSDCKKISKTLVGIVPDYQDAVTFEEINVSDGSKESAAKVKDYKVTVVPTLVFLSKDGKKKKKTEGILSEEEIRTTLNNIK